MKTLEKMIAPYVDRTFTDGFSNFIAEKHPKTKKEAERSVMLYAHMDEIGLMIKHIDDKGFLFFETIGGWDPRVLPSQRVQISTSKGKITGVIGCKPPHIQTRDEMEKSYKVDDLFIDIGAANKGEAEKWGIQIGSTVTLDRSLEQLGKGTLVSGKALDDRLGCAILVDIARRMAEKELDYTIYYGGTVQEEVDLSGAKVAAFGITPTLALVIDDSLAGDVPGVDEKRAPLKIGKGPGITIMDSGFIISEKVKELLVSAAEDDYIPYQFEVLRGGTTDAATIRTTKTGILVGVLSVPVRYGHSSVEVVDLQDMVNTMRLVISILGRLDEKKLDLIL
ncbi:M42 family metallopeptidase [Candidatus Bathyarchaeota archaeon]|nr:M42 family metallopeptidase [Candidatus Bathyarchaeota archaeon]